MIGLAGIVLVVVVSLLAGERAAGVSIVLLASGWLAWRTLRGGA